MSRKWATMYMLGTLCTSCEAGRMSYIGAPIGMLKCSTCPNMCQDKTEVEFGVEDGEGSVTVTRYTPPLMVDVPVWGPYFQWEEMR